MHPLQHGSMCSLNVQSFSRYPDSFLSSYEQSLWLREKLSGSFCKGRDSKYFSFVSHMVSVAATQFCHCSTKALTDNTLKNKCDYDPLNIYRNR